jgi:HAD superfamily hydrolase (TIGR01509 family)
MRLVSGAIFDMDGVLLDSMPFWEDLGISCLRDLGIVPDDDLIDVMRTMTLAQTVEYFSARYGVGLSFMDVYRNMDEKLERFYLTEAQPKQGVREYLGSLKDMGVKMSVLTATESRFATAALERLGLRGFFMHVVSTDDLGTGKDEPAAFEHVLELLGTPKEQTWVYEDSIYALRTAHAAGFPVIGVFDRSSAGCAEEIRALADAYVETFAAASGKEDQ